MLVDQSLPGISDIDSFSSQSKEKIKIPKKTAFNYKFTSWLPTNPDSYPSEMFPYPILPDSQYKILTALKLLALSKTCRDCKKTIFPKPSEQFKLPLKCPFCKNLTKKSRIPEPKESKSVELKRSSTVQRLSQLLDSIFIKYNMNAEFQEMSDYTERFHHEINQDIYLRWTINKDAAEVKSCVDALISFDKWPARYFMIDGNTHGDLFEEVLNNEDIFKFEPFYKLLIMASSVVKAVVAQIKPQIRSPRMSPSNVTNVTPGKI